MADVPSKSPSDDGTGDGWPVSARYDWSSKSPAMAVIETVAAAVDQQPSDLDRLYEHVDTDALDAFIQSYSPGGSDVTLTFSYAGHLVSVDATGEVVVRQSESARD